MDKTIKVGIIGFGLAGKVFHAPIIEDVAGLELTQIYTSNHEAIKHINSTYPNVEVASSPDDIIKDEEIHLIVVATPNTTHFDYAKRSLLAGKDVVVDKPFTVTSQEADELIEVAKSKGKLLSIHQNRRWDSDFLTVKRILSNKLLGNLVEYEAYYHRFRNRIKVGWREEVKAGGGILYDLGSHLIDQALSLFGLPKDIFADIRIQRENAKVDDAFEIILNYEKLKVVLKSGMLVKEPLPRFVLLGDKGSFIKYGLDPQEDLLKKGEFPHGTPEWGAEDEDIWGTLNTEIHDIKIRGKVESEKGDYREYYRNIYKAINGLEDLKVKAQDGRNVIRIIELAMESSSSKRTVAFR
ncbi:oxidoreductase [Alkaliphilus serpentinus]|uniref:Oxidoreductase n=1 Tax=Alkaliphilus serpentinus TaxID=1482731 RepID=A0A833HPQ7_9FIRM|nr:oxidoreductase [Alkaliphilus serpentinus]KAB3531114.1 oxidoreductase [Alkaliphilus serpentinus]